jgi:hypothetical protein
MVAADNARPHTAAESQQFMPPNGMVIIDELNALQLDFQRRHLVDETKIDH